MVRCKDSKQAKAKEDSYSGMRQLKLLTGCMYDQLVFLMFVYILTKLDYYVNVEMHANTQIPVTVIRLQLWFRTLVNLNETINPYFKTIILFNVYTACTYKIVGV